MVSCKVCKQKGYIIYEVNILLEQGNGYRKIAKFLIKKYQLPISYQSIKRHKDHLKAHISNPNTDVENKGNFYYSIGKIRSRY
jgi:hypothetical protein